MDKKRELAAQIIDLFDDLLYQKGIEIPCEDKQEQSDCHDHENTAKLYGMEYWNLLDRVEKLLN